MPKKEKKPKVPKAKKEPKPSGRKPTLAPFVTDREAPFKIYGRARGKDFEATVLTSGIIRMDEKDYTSPSSAACAILNQGNTGKPRMVDGWAFWKYNRDGERVMLDLIRGKESPLEKAKSAAA
jgi:hypothetical protein